VFPRSQRGLALFAAVAVLSGLAMAVPAGVRLWLSDDQLVGADTPAAAGPGDCNGRPVEAVHQLRGMTITTVNNLDWPSAGGLDEETVKAQYRGWLDLAQRLNFNAVFVHIRPSGDAFWPSAYAPWSRWLTGRADSPDPGWDPLQFMVSETHRRNIEFHAWFNPYRGSPPTLDASPLSLAKLPVDNPLRRHPEWAVLFPTKSTSPRIYFNPGIPEARHYVEDAMLDAVARYDLDGVFFDDFFYPYPQPGQDFNDAAAFARYGAGFASKADWRRNNVNKLVQEMNQRIKAIKPWVKFGISPFGIWRNQSTDPLGSPTKGLQSFDEIYVDTRLWVREQWVDYIAPQLYWQIGLAPADYARLVPWWARQVAGTRVQLYIAHADYRVGERGAWRNPAQLDQQLTLDARNKVPGSLHFSATHVRADALGAVTRYDTDHYAAPALVPTMAQLPAAPPPAPVITSVRRDETGAVALAWRPSHGRAATGFAVYRFDPAGGPDERPYLVATVRSGGAGEQSWVDRATVPGQRYGYCVTGLDRVWNEGMASAANETT
jgi:uncharacterized lipoprotein YddW (UPF0748 family)